MPAFTPSATQMTSSHPVAVVLGAAVWPGGVASPTLARRANHAAQLYLDGTVDHIIACGGLGKNAPTEAQVIRQICLSQGVPATAISQEDKSTTTDENIRLALPILQGLQRNTIVVVTDHYHAPRARMTARHHGLNVSSASPSLKGSHPIRLLRAILREIPAYFLYAVRLHRERLNGSRSH